MSSENNKIVVLMSGGVDSSVAAGLLIRQGWDVTGLYLRMHPPGSGRSGCGGPQDVADARRVAEMLGVDFHARDVGETFEPVAEQFAAEYARGRTPNPCLLCNPQVKYFEALRLADEIGAACVATGHYARVDRSQRPPAVLRGQSRKKDQSYVLFHLRPEQLARVVLPIGELADKDETRGLARAWGLPVHAKPDSQDICFGGNGDYTELLAQLAPEALRPGEIVNAAGEILGQHDGYARYTIGQRKGLGIAAGVPLYVTRIDAACQKVTVGLREEVLT